MSKYGEVKTKKNIFPYEAKQIVEKGNVDILIIQAVASDKTKRILDDGGVTLYEGLEPRIVEQLREIVAKELELKEKKETE